MNNFPALSVLMIKIVNGPDSYWNRCLVQQRFVCKNVSKQRCKLQYVFTLNSNSKQVVCNITTISITEIDGLFSFIA